MSRLSPRSSVVPKFHTTTPFYLKCMAVAAVKYPYHHSYESSGVQVLAPLLITAVTLFAVYAYPVVVAQRQHASLARHVISVAVCFFVYFNITVVAMKFEPAIATLLALLCSTHILYHIERQFDTCTSDITATLQLIAGQDTLSTVFAVVKFAIFGICWAIVPHQILRDDYVLYALFTPEIIGTLITVPFRLY